MSKKIRKIKKYYCPKCKKCLRGNPIPKNEQEFFGASHFGLEHGRYDRGLDRTVDYQCPFCKHTWGRI